MRNVILICFLKWINGYTFFLKWEGEWRVPSTHHKNNTYYLNN